MRVFIGYRRKTEADVAVASAVFDALSDEHDVFIDRIMPMGVDWVRQIGAGLNRSDFLICLLSAQSVARDMVGSEISMAHELA